MTKCNPKLLVAVMLLSAAGLAYGADASAPAAHADHASAPAASAASGPTPAPKNAYLYIGYPNNNQTLPAGKPVKVWFGLRNMGVAPV